ncbi:DnaA regulatory inactivator Hda [Neisseria sp. Ec49-e6-T10]|uniref:DnaA regulatory inactivator Hda n=1 Tax=Neisseria sp. Ec49-e6-T10 TaxID=3140744 RepID=UPI003EBBB4F6
MVQSVFDFTQDAYPQFDHFLGQGNLELINVLKAQQEPFVYLWGDEGVGKSYLLKAWVQEALSKGYQAIYLDIRTNGLPDKTREYDFIALDHIEALNEEEQIRLFSIFNQFKDQQTGFLLISAQFAPWHLTVREDLRTRMGYCLVYEVAPLSDEEKVKALQALAQAKQLHIADDIFIYLLNHWRRDLNSLIQLLNTLDLYSLAVKKPITLPLVKKVINHQDQDIKDE